MKMKFFGWKILTISRKKNIYGIVRRSHDLKARTNNFLDGNFIFMYIE